MKGISFLAIATSVGLLASSSPALSEPVDYVYLLNKYGPPLERIEKETLRQSVWVYKDKTFTLDNGRHTETYARPSHSDDHDVMAPATSKPQRQSRQRHKAPSNSQRNEIIKALSQIESSGTATAFSPATPVARQGLSARSPGFPFDQPVQAVRPLSPDN